MGPLRRGATNAEAPSVRRATGRLAFATLERVLEWILILLSPALAVGLVAGVRRLTRSTLTKEQRGVWGRRLVGFGAPSFLALVVASVLSSSDSPFVRALLGVGLMLCTAALFAGAALLESRVRSK